MNMKILIAGVLTLAAFIALHIPILKKKKGIILALYALGMILFFAVYNFRTLGNIITFYHPTDQTVYQKEFLENGEYPDAFLDEFLKGRTIHTPNDAYDTSAADELSETLGNYWLYYWYHAVNIWNYLELNDAVVIKDDSLNGIELSSEQKSHFEYIGPANDMLRYTFPLTPYKDEWGNAFYYYWYYYSYVGNSGIYICPEDIKDAKELVLIWQPTGVHDTDNYYIASKDYYYGVIAK